MAVKIAGTEVLTDKKELVNVPKITISEDVHSFVFEGVKELFVYDTRYDCDGGAWRKNGIGTSWYMETLNTQYRGASKDFPEVALIAVSDDKFGIYDLTSAGTPLWLLDDSHRNWFYGLDNYSVEARNGIIALSNNSNARGKGLYVIDLLEDTLNVFCDSAETGLHDGKYLGNGKFRLETGMNSEGYGSYVDFRNYQVNALSLGVLPGGAKDGVTGLSPITLAVGTHRSVEIINDVRELNRKQMAYDHITMRTVQPTRSFSYVVYNLQLLPDGSIVVYLSVSGTYVIPFSNYPRAVMDSPSTYLGVPLYTVATLGSYNGNISSEWGNRETDKFSLIQHKVSPTSFISSKGYVQMYSDSCTENSLYLHKALKNSIAATIPTGKSYSAYSYADSLSGVYPSDPPSPEFSSGNWVLGEGFSVVDGKLSYAGGVLVDSSAYLSLAPQTEKSAVYKVDLSYSETAVGVDARAYSGAKNSDGSGGSFGTYTMAFNGQSASILKTDSRFAPRYLVIAAKAGSEAFTVDHFFAEPFSGSALLGGTIADKPVATGAELLCGTGFNASYFDVPAPYYGLTDNTYYTVNFWLKWEEAATVLDDLLYVALDADKNMSVGYKNLPPENRIVTPLLDEWSLITVTKKGPSLVLHVNSLYAGMTQVAEESGTIGSGRSGNFSVALFRISSNGYSENTLKHMYKKESGYFRQGARCVVRNRNSNIRGGSYDHLSGNNYVSNSVDTYAIHGYALDVLPETRVGANSVVGNNTIVGTE